MATTLSGNRQLKLTGTFDEKNMGVSVPFPAGFHGGKVILPFAGNEFFTSLDKTVTVGTADSLAAVVSNAVPIIMGIVFNCSGGSGTYRLRTTNLVDIFRLDAAGADDFVMNFAPIGLVRENVEHGLHILLPSGTAGVLRMSIWGYYGELP